MAAAHSPLEQFTIERLIPLHIGSIDISYTNSALLMTIAVALATLLLVGATARAALVPGRMQSVAELSYEFIAGMVQENVGSEGRQYFPLVFSVFIFILFGNLLGLIPYSFTFTGQIVVTFALALFVFALGDDHRAHPARRPLLYVLFSAGGADRDGAIAGADRDHLLSDAAGEP